MEALSGEAQHSGINKQAKPMPPFRSITLHLLPGILSGTLYYLIRQPVLNRGYPPVMALIIALVVIIIPFELGYLLYRGKRSTGRLTLRGIISYRTALPWWQYLLYGGSVFVITGLIFTALKPVEKEIYRILFSWVPQLGTGLDGTYGRPELIRTYTLFIIFVVILGPLVEELYFRGYLLPRMKGRGSYVVHSLLFALYHTFSPWMVLTRTLGLLPLIYVVKRKSIYIGIGVHILLNSIDAVVAFIFIAGMGSAPA